MNTTIYEIIPNKIIKSAKLAEGFICIGCGKAIELDRNCRRLTSGYGYISHDNDRCFAMMLDIKEDMELTDHE